MARPSSFGRDTGLQIRMLVTIFLLGAVYAVLIGVLFAAGASGITILLVAGGLLALQFFTSDKLALRSMGAHEVSPQDAPELHATIERLCIQADLPKPRDLHRQQRDAQRLRPGTLEEGRGGVRDDGHPRAALARPSSRASWPTS